MRRFVIWHLPSGFFRRGGGSQPLLPGAQQGLGAISGGAETFFGAGKATAADKVFARLTSIVGVVFVIVALVLNLVH